MLVRSAPTGPSSAPVSQTRVLIVQAVAKHYRRPLFDRLHERLGRGGIGLTVIYSAPNSVEALKGDNIDLPAAYGRCVPGHWWFGNRVLYQPILSEVARSRLVILEQANKYLMSYPVLALGRLGVKKVAYWGHGHNMQANAPSFTERWKRALLSQVDWWFAYTQSGADYVASQGFDRRRITNVRNSVDTAAFSALVESVTPAEVQRQRARLDLAAGSRMAIFCGSLYEEKCLPFLIESADRVRREIKNFHLTLIGSGPMREAVEREARARDWLHFLGPLFGREKAEIFKIAEVFMNPGLIGLGVLDAFAAHLPVLTTDYPHHSPEIEYVREGCNGLITSHSSDRYAETVVRILSDRDLMATLRRGAAESAKSTEIDVMADQFLQGIRTCLDS